MMREEDCKKHELNEDAVCILCGFDACEDWHLDHDRNQKLAEEWDYDDEK